MASVAIVIGGAVVNALAFSGSNYLFAKMGKGEAEEERKRHDQALERLASAEQDYERQRIQRLDFINERMEEQKHAVSTFTDVDKAIREYYLATGEDLSVRKPKLSDFYQPSDNQKTGEIIFILLGMAAVYCTALFIQGKKNGSKDD